MGTKKKSEAKAGTGVSMSPRLEGLRRAVSKEQKRFLTDTWRHYLKTEKWPLCRVVHSQQGGKSKVKELLLPLTGNVVYEAGGSPPKRYQLTILGVLLTEEGDHYSRLLCDYLGFLRKKFFADPERTQFKDSEFATELGLDEDNVKTMGQLVCLGSFSSGHGIGGGSWSVSAPDEVEDLPAQGGLEGEVERLAFRWYDEKRSVFQDDGTQSIGVSRLVTSEIVEIGGVNSKPMAGSSAVDVLKRRYQVFVSSTYQDLIEERQHVMQALLETKCIPTGMELFPAASTQQWDLIQRVIDECDYYVVIVGGRYGSVSETGVGYTEREFDYAVKKGKPVLGFYHANPEEIPAKKIEKDDSGKRAHAAFVAKVKARLCRPWLTPSELGSAVKSAILNELEYNPRPGWIRADSVPNPDAVDKLKQKIADLEEQLKRLGMTGRRSMDKVDVFSVPFEVQIGPEGEDVTKLVLSGADSQTITFSRTMSAGDVLTILVDKLRSGSVTEELRTAFNEILHDSIAQSAASKLGQNQMIWSVTVEWAYFDKLVHRLAAENLIKQAANYIGGDMWEITPKGYKTVSHAKALQT